MAVRPACALALPSAAMMLLAAAPAFAQFPGGIQAYQAAGRTPPTFTDLAIAPGLTVIRAVHLNELRTAVLGLL